jgi:hemerythrin
MTDEQSPNTKPVGLSDMEAEHKLMHELLEQLRRQLAEDNEETVSELLGKFVDVTNLHFIEEQSLMRLHAYPGYAAHEQEHDALVAELEDLTRRIKAGEFSDAGKATESLETWLSTHMQTTDAALEEFLAAEGIRASEGQE